MDNTKEESQLTLTTLTTLTHAGRSLTCMILDRDRQTRTRLTDIEKEA